MARREHRVTPDIRGGKIDSTTSSDLRTSLNEAMPNVPSSRPFTLIVDLRNITYMSSSGIKELLGAQKRAKERGGKIILDMVTENIQNKLSLSGIDLLIPTKGNRRAVRR